jgi:hypothetical protein
MGLHYLGWQEVFGKIEVEFVRGGRTKIWGPPRGGAVVAGLIQALGCGQAVADASEAAIFVDDIYDTGRTQRRVEAVWGRKQWWFVVDKRKDDDKELGWIVFPWEDPAEEAREAVAHQDEPSLTAAGAAR